MANPQALLLNHHQRAEGTIQLPGSKSISNRYLLLSALSEGKTIIHNLLDSDDTDRMKEALTELGIEVIDCGEERFEVVGKESGALPGKEADLFLGNAGTAFRSLTAALALNGGKYRLHGIPRMHERPIKDLVDALQSLGLSVSYEKNEGYPPLLIEPSMIQSTKVSVKGSVSSQYLTALLLSLPMVDQTITIEIEGELISKPYIDITLEALRRFGIEIENNEYRSFVVPRETSYQSPGEIYVEGDASSASYFLAAGAIAGDVTVNGIGRTSIQGDIHFATALEKMGADVEWRDNAIRVRQSKTGLRGIDLDCNHIPDAAMTLAIVALYANSPTTLRNIASWRVKETDRIAAMATELTKLGVKVEEGEDYIKVYPQRELTPHVAIDTYDDHRIAMCFSLCSFLTPITINDPACVNKTFPTYFDHFSRIVRGE